MTNRQENSSKITLEQKQLVENYIRKVVISEITKKNRLNEDKVVKSLPVRNKDYFYRLDIEEYERLSRDGGSKITYRVNSGGGLSVSILDLIPISKEFSTLQEAEKFAKEVTTIWTKFLDKYYRK